MSLPFKSVLLAQATFYNLPLSKEKISVCELHDIITNHEREQIELTKRIAETPLEHHAYSHFTEDAKNKIIEKADIYHIPYDLDTVNYMQLAYEIDDYELMLDEAADRLLNWDTSSYDPEGLQAAINKYNEEIYFDTVGSDYDRESYFERNIHEYEDWKSYNSSVRIAYNSSRGV
jgi:hypothetical protein